MKNERTPLTVSQSVREVLPVTRLLDDLACCVVDCSSDRTVPRGEHGMPLRGVNRLP